MAGDTARTKPRFSPICPGSVSRRGHQIDLTSTKDFDDHFSLGLNLSRKINQLQDSPNTDWFGAAIYAKYKVKESLIFGFRGEYIDDADGVIIASNTGDILSFTFSTNLKYQGLTFIPEFRIDHANDPVFQSGENESTESSPAILMAVVYAF